ncbi:hypothetical protein Hamer_G021492, partial [Homarus americanus]
IVYTVSHYATKVSFKFSWYQEPNAITIEIKLDMLKHYERDYYDTTEKIKESAKSETLINLVFLTFDYGENGTNAEHMDRTPISRICSPQHVCDMS